MMQEVADIPATELPDVPKGKNQPEGSGAAVDLMKVLLKLVSERHGVAAKVIATVDDLEKIACDDEADVAALKGWRKELFGQYALRIKRGEMALRLEGKRVGTIECDPPELPAQSKNGKRTGKTRKANQTETSS